MAKDGQPLCNKEQLIGEWTVLFATIPADRLYFQIMDETLPHSEEHYVGCLEESTEIPGQYIQPSLSP